MTNSTTSLAGTAAVIAVGSAVLYAMIKDKNGNLETPPAFLRESSKLKALLSNHADSWSDDTLVKIVRQLDFWHSQQNLSETDLDQVADKLIRIASFCDNDFQVPKVRFGKTELQIPIVTCGGMRLQQTWLPDTIPILSPRRSQVLSSPSQANLLQSIRKALQVGINHFETGRFYGTSEYQFVDALVTLMDAGEIRREDFIFQTKLPATESREKWEENFQNTWIHVQKLGYIDLMSFWCVSSQTQVEQILSDADDMCMAAALQYKKEGKIKHIGFSTHSTAENILRMIESNKFEYVNLHRHFFGDYHAEGTPDTMGTLGTQALVKRALELDMGVFNISPFDKGGMLYKPSGTVATIIGPKLTPIAFAALHSWKTHGMHTISVGMARPSDLAEVLEAADMFMRGELDEFYKAEVRLKEHTMQKLGKDWTEQGSMNLPTCYDEASNGVAISHVLWLHNLMAAYGMYDFCKTRYDSLMKETKRWNKKKKWEENVNKMSTINPGRAYCPDMEYTEALSNHFDADAVKQKMAECHEWLTSKWTVNERQERGWKPAYDLRTWDDFPGIGPSPASVILQNATCGWFGCRGGPFTSRYREYAKEIRRVIGIKS